MTPGVTRTLIDAGYRVGDYGHDKYICWSGSTPEYKYYCRPASL